MTHIQALIPLGLLAMSLSLGGCESDYTLGNETPTSLAQASPTQTEGETPPEFSATPSLEEGTPEPGGWSAAIRVEPESVDLGTYNLGCEQSVTLTVFNDGTVPITITNLRMVGRAEAWDLDITEELSTLLPASSGTILIDADAQAIGDDDVVLQINADLGLAASVPIFGSVVDLIEPHVDTYFQEPERKVDVLWVIDNSGSMGDDQEALAENFDAFMNYFVPMGIQYNMGVTTTDMSSPTQFGKLQGNFGDGKHYIDWLMREAGDDKFRQTIKTLGASGSSSERGLSAMKVALSPEQQAGHNAGFLRADAYLAVVFVSDEEDQSPGYETRPATYYQDYVDFLVDLKGSVDNVICSSIVNPADPGGYPDMAHATGGVVEPIHGDYYKTLLEIGRVSAGFENAFVVSANPGEGDEIIVSINGEAVPPGEDTWHYDEETGAIIFAEDAVPDEGDRIDISYSAPPECVPLTVDSSPTPAP